MRLCSKLPIGLVVFAFHVTCLPAATIYDEAIMPDLSNSGLSPTALTVAVGSNQIFGNTGRGTNATDRDYFTFTLRAATALAGIKVLPGTQSGGLVSFIGLQSGGQITVSTAATDAAGLLGWWHYSPADINTDILPEMAVPNAGSSGFTVPLGPGTYSVWIQDFNNGPLNYGFDLQVVQTPEPSTVALMIGGLSLLGAPWLKRTNPAR